MKQVSPEIYTKEYYLNHCLGFEEFQKNFGKQVIPRNKYLLDLIEVEDGMKVLDIGCGRGDMIFYCASLGMECVGIDYSKKGISIANDAKKHQRKSILKKVSFSLMDAKKIDFPDSTFDLVISVDVFEHLYKEELELVLSEVKRVLKPNGILLVHTEFNKIYLNFTHKNFIFPVSKLLLRLNKLVTNNEYPGLPKDPRSDLHKIQHVNEPTIFYLRNLLKRFNFNGKIISHIGLLKKDKTWKDYIYNCIVLLYPFSLLPPLIYFFATDYTCVMRNKK